MCLPKKRLSTEFRLIPTASRRFQPVVEKGMPLTLKDRMQENAAAVETVLDQILALHDDPENRLIEAMRYASLGGGKRVRPFLVLETAGLFDVDQKRALRVAAAVEMIHCYSLVHDDLPAMDDDDLRRGKATCHMAYDEATAILAGDALLTRAFEVLADAKTHDDAHVRSDLVLALAKACGSHGMVGGQMLDILAENTTFTMPEITRFQQMKTGRLISAACEMGAIMGHAGLQARRALRAYSQALGLAFQIADDLLDREATAEDIGKATGKDAPAGKETFVSLMGVEQARAHAQRLRDQAMEYLEIFGEKGHFLRMLAEFVVNRRN